MKNHTPPKNRPAGIAANTWGRALKPRPNVPIMTADAPQATLRLDAGVTEPATRALRTGLRLFPPAKRVAGRGLKELGIPSSLLTYVDYPTHFDSTDARAAMRGTAVRLQLIRGADSGERLVRGTPAPGATEHGCRHEEAVRDGRQGDDME